MDTNGVFLESEVKDVSGRYIDADELIKFFPDDGEGNWTYNVTAQSYINIQPTVDVPQWISCSEEQPLCDGDYLVTLDFAWGKEIEMGEWFEGEWINPNSHVTVAWMPLPNPWKGEADGRVH